MSRAVKILRRQELFHRFIFRIEEVTLQHELFNGSMSEEITRLILQRGDSVAMLLCDREKQTVLLCEQFRAPTLDQGPGWLIEIPAGTLESGEDAEECARREALEETGFSVKTLRRIACVYLSPGGSSERIHLFYGDVSTADRAGKGGGVVNEGEDIRLIFVPTEEAIAKARSGQILDAKTLIGLQWLDLANTHSIF
ncbi:MAG TPA: NUDIX domain-containing protein [Candidatus Angelobacter sp.]